MSNILRLGKGKKISNVHGAVFPETLPEELIKNFSEEGDLVYDPFMGSGTVGKVCKSLNRNYIGSEISEEYCKIAEERIL
jgi:site-specific DNA-methyltransferase (adenine-specific)/modification methylase